MHKQKTLLIPVTAVFFVVQTAIIAALILKGRTDYAWSVLITTCFWLVYTFLEIRFRLKMSAYVRILMTLTIFFDAFFGDYFDLYEHSFVFDKLLHVFGSYAFSLFAYTLVAQLPGTQIGRPARFILTLCLGVSLGVFYEISEFIGDLVSHPMPPNQPGLLDTDLDLVGDTIGAFFAAVQAALKKSSV